MLKPSTLHVLGYALSQPVSSTQSRRKRNAPPCARTRPVCLGLFSVVFSRRSALDTFERLYRCLTLSISVFFSCLLAAGFRAWEPFPLTACVQRTATCVAGSVDTKVKDRS